MKPMKTPRTNKPKRSPDQDRITFNLPKKLKAKMDEERKKDRRSMSQWLVMQLEQITNFNDRADDA